MKMRTPELLKAKPVVEPVTKAQVVNGYAALRMKINRKSPQEVRALLARLGCERITVKKTGPHTWDFAGEFDAGRVLNIAPSSPPDVPFYSVPSSAANPSKFFEIPFRGTVAEPSTRPARAPKAPPR
jgi:hypothetical protein